MCTKPDDIRKIFLEMLKKKNDNNDDCFLEVEATS